MTDTTTTEPTTDAAETDTGSNNEAAKYRRRLREVESERDGLATRLQAAQRREIERMAGDTVTRPEALWAAGIDLDSLLDDSGEVNPEAVTEAVTEAAERLGLARPSRTPRPDPTQGGHGDVGDAQPQFSDAFAPKR